MNHSQSDNAFVPKPALSPTAELYDELTGDGMENLAKATIAQMPPIPDGAVVHDNGCGTGAATAAILASLSGSAASLSIKGTDVNENALDVYRKRADERGWPAESIHMDSSQLSFCDNFFTHSIGSALLFVLPEDGVTAMKEVYRTLKPGGTAAVNCWAHTPNIRPIQAAAKATRPAGTPFPREGVDKWSDPDFLLGVVQKGGFEKGKIRADRRPCFNRGNRALRDDGLELYWRYFRSWVASNR